MYMQDEKRRKGEHRAAVFVAKNAHLFPSRALSPMQGKLSGLDEATFNRVTDTTLHHPTMMLICSLLLGWTGIDRFILGEKKMGYVKLFTLGLFGIITIRDWFEIQDDTQRANHYNMILAFESQA